MPQIIVAADRGAGFGRGAVTFRERVNVADFQSEHFAAQLVERLGWAVEDADIAERAREEPAEAADIAQHTREDPAEADAAPVVEDRRQRSVASVVTTASYTPAP